jgi:hypothetical protein
MRNGRSVEFSCAVLYLICSVLVAGAQSPNAGTPGRLVLHQIPGPAEVPSDTDRSSQVANGDIVREIDDPHNGDRWLLVGDQSHPGRPGRLLRVPVRGLKSREAPVALAGERANSVASTASAGVLGPETNQGPILVRSASPLSAAETEATIVRAGDRVVIEENTPIVEARLEAVALGPALIGSSFRARLSIGGYIVQAVALAPGRASLEAQNRPEALIGGAR